MDRPEWLKEKRRLNEAQEDAIYAPIYDDHWGTISPTHHQFFNRFLSLCPPQGHILDAPCGTGKYWSLILTSGRTVFGIDHSRGMLARAHEKFPDVPCEQIGLQELRFHARFDGAVCLDALEVVPPEEWPLVLGNLHRALKPTGYLYVTVETAAAHDLEKAFAEGRQAGLPIVYGEWAEEGGYHADWAQDGFYHYYPKIEQVRDWLQFAGFHLIDEAVGDEYHHFVVQKA